MPPMMAGPPDNFRAAAAEAVRRCVFGMMATDEAGMTFESFVAEHGQALMRLAFVLTGHRQHAEDLAQTALVDAYRNWAKVAAARRPDSYVQKVLVNAHLSWRRRRWTTERPSEMNDAAAGLLPDPSDALVERDHLRTMLAGLAPRARTVLVLRYYADLTDAAIAETMGITESSVRATASRALATLRGNAAGPASGAERGRATPPAVTPSTTPPATAPADSSPADRAATSEDIPTPERETTSVDMTAARRGTTPPDTPLTKRTTSSADTPPTKRTAPSADTPPRKRTAPSADTPPTKRTAPSADTPLTKQAITPADTPPAQRTTTGVDTSATAVVAGPITVAKSALEER
jgi:RNA polymerase sigma-70 factor (sigma-E family)